MYRWVEHNGVIGKIVCVYPWWLLVKWLVTDKPFRNQPFESFFASGATYLHDEPRLNAVLAAQYLGTSRQWIYKLNRDGAFGEVRNPFWVLPSELDRVKCEQQHERAA